MQPKIAILNETENWIAVNKPAGLLSIPDREGKEASLKTILQERYGKIFTVHRIDRDTSGLIIFAKNEMAHRHLSLQFEDRTTVKIYSGLVLGSPAVKQGEIESPIAEHPAGNGKMMIHRKGKPSHTSYEVLEELPPFSFIRFQLHTGRTHQIRAHMQSMGHPLVCDELYGDGKPILVSSFKSKFKLSKSEEEERPILGRLGLHAERLEFTDIQGDKIVLEAPLPKDMQATLQQLRKYSSRKTNRIQ
jgi:23S rRNA pseudouridine955/2504/2580 synthase/23S rRNA pseudouridine1911/1915/1917 synthase